MGGRGFDFPFQGRSDRATPALARVDPPHAPPRPTAGGPGTGRDLEAPGRLTPSCG